MRANPLSQTNFFPLFTHVYFLPFELLVVPALLQIPPAFGGVAEIEGDRGAKSRRAIRTTLNFMERNDNF